MPYKSAKQSRYLHARKPKVAAKFDRDVKKKRKPKRKTKGKK